MPERPPATTKTTTTMTKKLFRVQQTRPTIFSAVEGFVFPLQSEQEVDRLEYTARSDRIIRDQYIALLQEVKPHHQDPSNVFADLFSDEALLGYNYYGKTNQAKKKKAMRKYIIFTECMVDAWLAHGVTEECLRIAIVKVIARLNHKVRSRGYRRNLTSGTTAQQQVEGEEEGY
ncbi:AAEL004650-PA [Aedes aegypti]|uniref:AAEL004650-PA n=1 Tax=Aedes aegypti TaxID=7159 RepID=Q17CC1_AEDAE|nr:AAEL004650-PA [Aedes aegypti]